MEVPRWRVRWCWVRFAREAIKRPHSRHCSCLRVGPTSDIALIAQRMTPRWGGPPSSALLKLPQQAATLTGCAREQSATARQPKCRVLHDIHRPPSTVSLALVEPHHRPDTLTIHQATGGPRASRRVEAVTLLALSDLGNKARNNRVQAYPSVTCNSARHHPVRSGLSRVGAALPRGVHSQASAGTRPSPPPASAPYTPLSRVYLNGGTPPE